MIKVLSVVVLTGILAACATPAPITLTKTDYTVIAPPESLYKCPPVKLPSKITANAVAKLIVEYEKANRECRVNMNAIKKFVQENEKIVRGM